MKKETCYYTTNIRGFIFVITAVRTVFMPKQWILRCSILDGDSLEARGGDGVEPEAGGEQLVETDVAGPCCFQADIVAHQRLLPVVRPGDIVLLHDVGGYFHAQHSRYNLRQMPPLYGFSGDDNQSLDIVQLQNGETIQQTIDAFA
jgi:diaminopimelate decarboxylase